MPTREKWADFTRGDTVRKEAKHYGTANIDYVLFTCPYNCGEPIEITASSASNKKANKWWTPPSASTCSPRCSAREVVHECVRVLVFLLRMRSIPGRTAPPRGYTVMLHSLSKSVEGGACLGRAKRYSRC